MTKQVELPEPVGYLYETTFGWSFCNNRRGPPRDDATNLFTADQMRQFREEGVISEAKTLAIELAASILEQMCDEAPLVGNFSATACALISATRMRRGEQPYCIYDQEEFEKLVSKLQSQAKGESDLRDKK